MACLTHAQDAETQTSANACRAKWADVALAGVGIASVTIAAGVFGFYRKRAQLIREATMGGAARIPLDPGATPTPGREIGRRGPGDALGAPIAGLVGGALPLPNAPALKGIMTKMTLALRTRATTKEPRYVVPLAHAGRLRLARDQQQVDKDWACRSPASATSAPPETKPKVKPKSPPPTNTYADDDFDDDCAMILGIGANKDQKVWAELELEQNKKMKNLECSSRPSARHPYYAPASPPEGDLLSTVPAVRSVLTPREIAYLLLTPAAFLASCLAATTTCLFQYATGIRSWTELQQELHYITARRTRNAVRI